MPIINFANPIHVIVALVLVVLCAFIAQQSKKNTIPCVVLLVFLSILVGHTIELSAVSEAVDIRPFAISIAVDEAFIFVSFLFFIWLDRIQIEASKTTKSDKKSNKKNVKEKKEEKVIENDGLDVLWKKV